MKGYIAVGHGVEQNGVFDPGAVYDPSQHGGTGPVVREYDLAFVVVQELQRQLSPVTLLTTESAGGPGHDPDYIGSTQAINAGNYDWAIEIHFNSYLAQRSGIGLWYSSAGRDWVDLITHIWINMGLPHPLSDEYRSNLYILRNTNCPTIIWECDRVGPDITDDELKTYARAIAIGTTYWLNRHFPNERLGTIGDLPPYKLQGDNMFLPTDTVGYLKNPHGSGGWTLKGDGGVFADKGTPEGFPYNDSGQVDYTVLFNDGDRYHFPTILLENAVVVNSYPGFPDHMRPETTDPSVRRFPVQFWIGAAS